MASLCHINSNSKYIELLLCARASVLPVQFFWFILQFIRRIQKRVRTFFQHFSVYFFSFRLLPNTRGSLNIISNRILQCFSVFLLPCNDNLYFLQNPKDDSSCQYGNMHFQTDVRAIFCKKAKALCIQNKPVSIYMENIIFYHEFFHWTMFLKARRFILFISITCNT